MKGLKERKHLRQWQTLCIANRLDGKDYSCGQFAAGEDGPDSQFENAQTEETSSAPHHSVITALALNAWTAAKALNRRMQRDPTS